ncbi:MAG: 4-oxalocrotonate tautomerase family protein [Acidobacteria bacterium]|nr:4-oxalocrotonate tautomerase family protein [Acidobacteriota bacterium]
MPYVNIKITREGGTTPEQKGDLIKGVTDVLVAVLDKSPSSTFVVIDEVDLENWGIGGMPVNEYRRSKAAKKPLDSPEKDE